MGDRRWSAAALIGSVLLMLALIWLSVWLAGPQDCSRIVAVRIGGMLVAGCDRR